MSTRFAELVACAVVGAAFVGSGCSNAQESASGAKIAGFAFVDSCVTGQGSRAELPQGTKIFPGG